MSDLFDHPEAKIDQTHCGARLMNVSQDIVSVLDAARVDGSALILTGTLDRKLYQAVAKTIEAAGGRWNRKAGAHLFEGDAAEAIEPIIMTGKVTNKKTELGQFFTPPVIADRVIKLAKIEPGMAVLEPSAGRGGLAIPAWTAGGDVMCIEIDPKNCRALVEAGFASVIETDFLGLSGLSRFHRIVMNPPFAGQADIDHVIHAAKFLEPGGRLVAIMAAGVLFRTNRKATDFRSFVAARGGEIEALPDGSFRESGTDVSTVIVTIDSPEAG